MRDCNRERGYDCEGICFIDSHIALHTGHRSNALMDKV